MRLTKRLKGLKFSGQPELLKGCWSHIEVIISLVISSVEVFLFRVKDLSGDDLMERSLSPYLP